MELADEHGTDAEPLFCCQVNWVESESPLRRWARQVDRPMYWLGAVLGFNWNPPWRDPASVNGVLFTSNLEVADFFRRIYGFTRRQWLKDQRLEQKRQDELRKELARRQAEHPEAEVGVRFGRFTSGGSVPTPEELAKMAAKGAFETFCRTSTNVAQ